MIRTLCAALFAAAVCTAAWPASPPPIVGDEGATIDALVREQKLVTIVLKDGSRAYNYRLRGIHEETLTITDSSGAPGAFPLDMVRELRVQKERIDTERNVRKDSALTTEDRKVVDAGVARAFDLFNTSRGNQTVKMQAAMALAASNHDSKLGAQSYLKELMTGNDAPTATAAAGMLWRVGVEPSSSAIENGLASGNRVTKAAAATLAGLTGDQRYLLAVRGLLRDPAVEIFPSAAKAIARLGDRESLPALYDGIRALDDKKGDACLFALTHLGGDDVKQRLLTMLPDSRGNEWFRIVRALHQLGDDSATKLLTSNALNQPAFSRVTALILVRDEGSVEAIQFMRDFLGKALDPNVENLVYKGQVGIALYLAGDIQAKGVVQDVLGTSPNLIYVRGRTSDEAFKQQAVIEIQTKVVAAVGDTLNREFVSLLAAPIQSPNPQVAVRACIAAIQIANPEFGARVRDFDL